MSFIRDGIFHCALLESNVQTMEKRYQLETPIKDEFMTPLIINEEGLIRGMSCDPQTPIM